MSLRACGRLAVLAVALTLSPRAPARFAGAAPASRATEGIPGVRASSEHPGDYLAQYAIDGDPKTRWASQPSGGPEWIQVDFGAVVPIEGLTIVWEAAHPEEYEVRVSEDGARWQTVYRKAGFQGGTDAITGLKAQGRYLRVLSLKPGLWPHSSIWEIEFPPGKAAQAVAVARRRAQEYRRQAEAEAARQAAEATRQAAEALPKLGVNDIIFAARASGVDGHWYANFGYYARGTDRKLYGAPGGRLCRLSLRTGQVTVLLDDPAGGVRDPEVHYDGRRILFSYRKGGTENYHLYEINADGTGLRQLTDGPWDDIEPTYLPDGGIMFVSSRCKRWVNCWLTQVATLYRCDADGRNMRELSANIEQDNTPWVMPDGRILYTRWEYVDRSQVDYHHLWTMNPDGTEQTVFFGNLHPGTVMIDAKPVPGTDRVLATFSPGHGQREHEGPFYLVDPNGGPDLQPMARRVGRAEGRDPYPLADGWILYAAGRSIRVATYAGAQVDLYTDPRFELHEPRPLLPHPREPVVPARADLSQATGKLFLSDVYFGRNLAGVARGEIKKLLVLETLPKPINFTGGMDPLTYGGSFTLERVLGTVPVEPDGSAFFEAPALRSIFFVALDKDNLAVKRMQSFCTVQPGETVGCLGCHEQRTAAGTPGRPLLAMRRPASRIQPIADTPQVFDFPRDIQPILDRHCLSCHDYDRHPDAAYGPRAGGVILSGDHGPMFSHSYAVLTVRHEFSDGRDDPRSNYPPRALGSAASPLMKKLSGEHYGVKLSPQEVERIRLWIDVGAPYPGTYAALGTGMIGGYDANNLVETDDRWPESRAAREAIGRRCASCHQGERSLPATLSDENGLSFWKPNWNDPRLQRSRHIVFNLSRPEKSLMLLAPLAKDAGGYGLCSGKVFADANDPDYLKILAMCRAGKRRLEEIKRFDMPGFVPDPAYIREMKRFGILSADARPPFDTYRLDEAYWQSLWWKP